MRLKKSTFSTIIILVALATVVVMSGLNFIIPNMQNNADSNTNAEEDKQKYSQVITMEKIFLTTRDEMKIAADLYRVENPVGWLVLVHMMPATKESWINLAKEFQKIGYESIAIDLRGHGESEGGPEGFLKFSDSEHQKSVLDLEAAVKYLMESRQATSDKIIFIGASIGANLSLQYLAEHSEYKTAVLLSPGLNYRGIKTEPFVQKLASEQQAFTSGFGNPKAPIRIFFVSAENDGDNAEQNKKLYDLIPSNSGIEKKIQIYQVGGHGTDILENQPELKSLIIDFIR